MQKQPFFSIGIPVYNTSPYLERCMNSIYSQSFTDFEIILVDDGSSDNSLEVLKQYAAKDDRITVITRPNDGPSSARNAMFYTAKGRYIYVLDSDDAMCDEVLAKAYEELSKNNFPDLLHTGFIRVVDGVETLCPAVYPGDEYFNPEFSKDERWIRMWLSKKTVDQVMTKFIKRELIVNNGISFITRLFAQEDSDFTFNLCRKADTMAYADFYAFRYYKNRKKSISTDWSYKAVAGVLSRWSEFYYDIEFYDISEWSRQQLAKEKLDLLYQLRTGTLRMASQRPKEECFKLINMLDGYFGRDIKNLPVTEGDINGIIFRMYKIFGLKKTYKWLYAYLEKKGAVLKQ